MIFTIISIFLSVFECVFSAKSIKHDNVAIIHFNIESQTIADLGYKKFMSRIAYQPNKFTYAVAKTLKLNKNEIESLIPSQYKTGVIFYFMVEFDDSEHYLQIEKTIKDLANIDSLINEASKIYNIKDMNNGTINATRVTMVKLTTESSANTHKLVATASLRSMETIQSLTPSVMLDNNNH